MDLKNIIEKIVIQGPESLTQEEKETIKSIGNQNGIKDFLSRISIKDIVMKGLPLHLISKS